ncbi:MAG: LysE family translocator [Oceanidesulfovibrio sp.]
MELSAYLAYLTATIVVLVVPGPTVMLVTSYGLAHGRRIALATAAGVVLGDATAMAFSLLGVSAVLAASSVLFTALKWLGAFYLIFLGLTIWRSASTHEWSAEKNAALPVAPAVSLRRAAGHAYAVTATNPKGIIFFTAFLPQFVTHTEPLAQQIALLGGTFLLLAFANAFCYAQLAARMGSLARRPQVMRWVRRSSAGVLLAAGAAVLVRE